MSTSTGKTGVIGRVVGGYTLVELLGKGASGAVYKGRPLEPGPPAAIKLFHEHDAGDEQTANARREFAQASQLTHRNIIRTLAVGQEGATTFMVMELLEGASLRDRLRQTPGPVDPLVALDLVAQLGLGLHHAHEQGLVHRDVKPANIWVTTDGEVKILDFGIAKASEATVTTDGALVGTIAYMSPEQVAGRGEPDVRSDVFSAGAVLYELLAGRKPFEADSVPALLARILNDAPPRLPAPAAAIPGLSALVDRALAKTPEQRFGDAFEFVSALWEVLLSARLAASGAAPGPAPAAAVAAPPPIDAAGAVVVTPSAPLDLDAAVRPAPRRSSFGAVAAVVLLAAAGAGGYYVVTGRSSEPSGSPVPSTTAVADGGAPDADAAGTPGAAAPPSAAVARDVAVSSDPADAGIAIDGKPAAGRTPFTLSLLPGQVLRFSRTGYAPAEVTVTEAMLATGTMQVTLAAAAPTRLHAVGEYPFEVVVGSRVASPAALEHTVTVTAGLPVRLRNSEYLLDVPVRLDQQRRDVDVRVPPAGRLSLRTNFEICAVFLDGRDFGYPPLAGLAVAAGRHSAELRCPDGRTLRSSFTIESGQPHVEVIR